MNRSIEQRKCHKNFHGNVRAGGGGGGRKCQKYSGPNCSVLASIFLIYLPVFSPQFLFYICSSFIYKLQNSESYPGFFAGGGGGGWPHSAAYGVRQICNRVDSHSFSYPEPFLRAVRRGALAKSKTGYHKNMVKEYIRY